MAATTKRAAQVTTTTTSAVLSAQEAAIQSGKRTLHDNITPRIVRMYEAIRASAAPRIQVRRAKLFTESFKETEGQPMVLRCAKAMKHVAENLEVVVLPGELIVGRAHTHFGRFMLAHPEVDGTLYPVVVDFYGKLKGQAGYVAIEDEDRTVISEEIFPYWNGRDYISAYARALPEDTRFIIFGPDQNNIVAQCGVIMASAAMRSSSNFVPDYAKILSLGCDGLKEEARQRLARLTNPIERAKKAPFFEAVLIICDALITWSKRYARLAKDLAAAESDPQRKRELLEIADVCDQVPEKPARTFREAIQVQWFAQIFSRMEQSPGSGVQSGRMDQYLYPFYKKDVLEEKRLTKEAAEELLQCLWLNMMQITPSSLNPSMAAMTEGFAHFEVVVLGGLNSQGFDATNELSYAILESTRPLQTSHPDLCVRFHANTPDRFLHATVEAIKDGKGLPKLLNDELAVPWYVAWGASMQEALDYNPSSCADSRVIHRETSVTGNGAVNFGVVVEMALRRGKVKFQKDAQFGLDTGDPRSFKTFDDLWEAFRAQLLHLVRHVMTQQTVANVLKPRYIAAPFSSMLFAPSMEHAMDLHQHEEGIPGCIDIGYVESAGIGTAIDSLAAIKHLVFDARSLTWDELLEAMDKNWEGHEATRQMCLNAPKYGNGVEWVDAIGWRIENTICEFCATNLRPNGLPFCFRQVPVTMHVPFGKVVGATPNGRHAGEFLSEGISASHGADQKGPTVALGSMARARAGGWGNIKGPDLINMKFSPANVAGEEGTRRLMQMIRTWSALKLWHIQFNILNRATLLDAQKNPEKYRDLIVRIAGYSAYFVDLSPMQQAEIIARTEEHMG